MAGSRDPSEGEQNPHSPSSILSWGGPHKSKARHRQGPQLESLLPFPEEMPFWPGGGCE